MSSYNKLYYQKNKERILERHARYAREKKEGLKEYERNRRREGRKKCPECGYLMRVWEKTCKICRQKEPKTCRRCGNQFNPDSWRRQVCDPCLANDREMERTRESASSADPCTKCRFLHNCRQEIHGLDGWPFCWTVSPHREEFLGEYLGQANLQGQLAKTLRDAIQGGNYEGPRDGYRVDFGSLDFDLAGAVPGQERKGGG